MHVFDLDLHASDNLSETQSLSLSGVAGRGRPTFRGWRGAVLRTSGGAGSSLCNSAMVFTHAWDTSLSVAKLGGFLLQLRVRLRSGSVGTSRLDVTESLAVGVVGVAARPQSMFDGFVLEYQKKSFV